MIREREAIFSRLKRLYGAFFKARTFKESNEIVEEYDKVFTEFRKVLGKHYLKYKEAIENQIRSMTESIDHETSVSVPNSIEELPSPIYEDSVYLNYANEIYIKILDSKDYIQSKKLAARLMEVLEEANHFWKMKYKR